MLQVASSALVLIGAVLIVAWATGAPRPGSGSLVVGVAAIAAGAVLHLYVRRTARNRPR